jgi:hypothetical protein
MLLREQGVPFQAHVAGACTVQPNLKQIFSKASPHSSPITAFIPRFLG